MGAHVRRYVFYVGAHLVSFPQTYLNVIAVIMYSKVKINFTVIFFFFKKKKVHRLKYEQKCSFKGIWHTFRGEGR